MAIRNHILKSASEVALAKTERLHREAQRRTEWARRLDPAAYRCERMGDAWIAEGPAGQRFEFRLVARYGTGHAAVAVKSQSGEEYSLHVHSPGSQCVCNCPAFAAGKVGQVGCKHGAGWVAVKRAAKEAARLPLAA